MTASAGPHTSLRDVWNVAWDHKHAELMGRANSPGIRSNVVRRQHGRFARAGLTVVVVFVSGGWLQSVLAV